MQGTNIELLERSPVPQAILKLSIPTVLSNIVSLLYNLTDTYFIGLPNSVSVIIMGCSNIILNNLASDFGNHVVSAYGVSGKLIQMVFMIVVGYGTGYMPFAGYN